MEELIRLAEEMNKELNRMDGSKSKEICFEAIIDGDCELNFGMTIMFVFNAPHLLIGRYGGGESFHGVLKRMKKLHGQLNTSLK